MKIPPMLVAVIVGIPTTDVDVSFLPRLEKSDLGDRAEQRGEERLVCATLSSQRTETEKKHLS